MLPRQRFVRRSMLGENLVPHRAIKCRAGRRRETRDADTAHASSSSSREVPGRVMSLDTSRTHPRPSSHMRSIGLLCDFLKRRPGGYVSTFAKLETEEWSKRDVKSLLGELVEEGATLR